MIKNVSVCRWCAGEELCVVCTHRGVRGESGAVTLSRSVLHMARDVNCTLVHRYDLDPSAEEHKLLRLTNGILELLGRQYR